MDDFRSFWEDMEAMFSEQNTQSSKKKEKIGKDISIDCSISFKDSVLGCQKPVIFERTSVCGTCHGTKAKPGTGLTKCTTCRGNGKIMYQQGYLKVAMDCSSCGGSGTIIRHLCNTCNGNGFTKSKVEEVVNIPRGVSDGINLRVPKKGNFTQTGKIGDLYLHLNVKPHTYFRRENYDIHTTNIITVSQAVLGGKIKIKTITGEVTITLDPGTNEGDIKKLVNYGIPKLPPNDTQRGHHYIMFKIKVPKNLNIIQKNLYESIRQHEVHSNEI